MHACCSVASGAERREVAVGHGLRGAVLLDRGDVERGQQVHGVDAGVGELRAAASCPRCPRVNARYVPRSASGTDSSEIEKSRMCSS